MLRRRINCEVVRDEPDPPKDSMEALTRDLGINGGGLEVGGAQPMPRGYLIPATAEEMQAELAAPDIQEAVKMIMQAGKNRFS